MTSSIRRKILVVDDEATARDVLQRALEKGGYATTTAADGQEALDAASKETFDLVLMDIRMPRMSSLEALSRLRLRYPDTYVIMLTAVDEVDTAMEAIRKGADDYIAKPLSLDLVLLRVEKALERRRLTLRDKESRQMSEQRLSEAVARQEQTFAELVRSMAREHARLFGTEEATRLGGKPTITGLPPELQRPLSSVEEFREALIRILKRTPV